MFAASARGREDRRAAPAAIPVNERDGVIRRRRVPNRSAWVAEPAPPEESLRPRHHASGLESDARLAGAEGSGPKGDL